VAKGHEISQSSSAFADLGVPTRFLKQLDRGGVHTPFPIQAAVLPDAYAGFDMPALQKPVDVLGLHFEYSKAATEEAKEVLRQFLKTIAEQAQ